MDAFYAGSKKVSDFVEKCTRIVVVPISFLFMTMVFLAVVTRFILKIPIVASLEYSRMGFVWFCMLGGSLAYKTGSHVKFTFLTDRVPETVRRVIAFVIHALCLTFFIIILVNGVKLNLRVAATTFPASKWSYNVMYLSLPISMLFCAIHAVYFILGELSGKLPGKTDKEEAKQ